MVATLNKLMENNILDYALAQVEATNELERRKEIATNSMASAMNDPDPTRLVGAFVVMMEATDKKTAWVCFHEALSLTGKLGGK